jgi:NADPH:quinone reductase-like Zn-dependent oxidoreductase
VAAFSLNAGETRAAIEATQSYIPGWDFAGVVEKAAADGSSPQVGTPVFGFVPQGSWAEYIVARAGLMAEIPAGVTPIQAASLPVAGVTALLCLERAGILLGRRVLVTGAAGGVGRFACQLATRAGAMVYAVSRRSGLFEQLQQDGVHPAAVFSNMAEAKTAGDYHVILDSVGGEALSLALTALVRGGICVNCGNSAGQVTSFDARELYRAGGTRFESVWLGAALGENCTPVLARLAGFVAEGRLRTPIDAVLSWVDVEAAARRLAGQHVDGKIVMQVS